MSYVRDTSKFVTNPGNPVHVLYSPRILDDGTTELIVSGTENTDELIQAAAESCDIYRLVASVNQTGDVSLLNQRQGTYGDFTDMPKTYAEALQMVIDGRNTFDKLPVDVRSAFGNDFNKWFSTAGSPDWLQKMSVMKSESASGSDEQQPTPTTPVSPVVESK